MPRDCRSAPAIDLITDDDFARVISGGVDTLVETLHVVVPEKLHEEFCAVRDEAAEGAFANDGIAVDLGGEIVQIQPYIGKHGHWIATHPDFTITCRHPNTNFCVSVQYRSAGLWQWGVRQLRDRVLEMLWRAGFHPAGTEEHEWSRVNQFHWCFDVLSPEFSQEMVCGVASNIVCHSNTTARENGRLPVHDEDKEDDGHEEWYEEFSCGGKAQTLTVGMHGKGLQVQVYDKVKEIMQASRKTWMHQLWERDGATSDDIQPRHIWRVEVRMGVDHLTKRQCRTFPEVMARLAELVSESLYQRRLARPNGDKNRSRWPMHPVWAACVEACGNVTKWRPLGKIIECVETLADQLISNVAGNLRNLICLQGMGKFDEKALWSFCKEELAYRLLGDPEHEKKVLRLKERLRWVKAPA